jgi:membrane fusion protein (multidrug efflux system)
MSKSLKKWFSLLAVLFLFVTSIQSVAQSDLLSVNSNPIEATSHQAPAHAVLVASDYARLSSQFSGQILNIPVKPGQNFKKGQILLRFRCEEQLAEHQRAIAQLKSTKESKDSANVLNELKSISKLELIKARSAHAEAAANAGLTKAVLDKCEIKAPFKGSVVDVTAKAHETVRPGDPLMEIVNNDSIYIKLFVPSTWLSWVKAGVSFELKLREYPHRLKAHVYDVGSSINTDSQTIEIYAKFDQPYPGLVNGMSGEAFFK